MKLFKKVLDPMDLFGGGGASSGSGGFNPMNPLGFLGSSDSSGGSGGGIMDMLLNPMSMMGGGGGGMGGMMSMMNPMSMFGGGSGGGGGIAGLPGNIISGGSSEELFGSKPKIPPYPTGGASIRSGIHSNLDNLDLASDLAAKVNQLNQDEILDMYEEISPGFKDMRSDVSKNLASLARGEIPQDVSDAIQNNAAAHAVGGGFGGSGMHANLLARDLGLTSLDLSERGRRGTEEWLHALSPRQFDVSQLLETPQQALEVGDKQYERNLLEAGVLAAPDPAIRGQFDTNMSLLGMLMGIYSGGPGYQGTYRPTQVGVGGPGGGSSFGPGYNYTSPDWMQNTSGGWDDSGGGAVDKYLDSLMFA